MLKDRTTEALRGRIDQLRIAADRAEDSCVKLRLKARAEDFEKLITVVTPVLSADEPQAVR